MEGEDSVAAVEVKCLEIEEGKRVSLESKKKLAEETKIFLSKSDEEKVRGFGALLKLYMSEIDGLSRRAKTSETFVLGLRGQVPQHRLQCDSLTPEIADLHAEIGKLQSLRTSEKTDIQVHKTLVEALTGKVRHLEGRVEEQVQAAGEAREAERTETTRRKEMERQNQELRSEIAKLRESEIKENTPTPTLLVPMLVGVVEPAKQDRVAELEREVQRLEENLKANVTLQAVSLAQTQRDRFRSRMLELEAERDDLRRAVNRNNNQDERRPKNGLLLNRKFQLVVGGYVAALHLLVLLSLARLASLVDQQPWVCCVENKRKTN